MTTATLTAKGQITIPGPIRKDMQIEQGDRLEFVKIGEGRYEVIPASKDISTIKGIVKAKRPVSIEEMKEAIKNRASKQ